MDRAEFLRDQCAPRAAAAVLRPLLRRYNPEARTAERLVIRAAVVFAETAFDTPRSQLAYARFAARTSCEGYGVADPLTLSAMTALVAVTVEQNLLDEAIIACRRLVRGYADRGEQARSLTWRREQAALLHRVGHCQQALEEITACLCLPAGLSAAERDTAERQALIRCAVILAGCGYTAIALTLLGRHGHVLPREGSVDRCAAEAALAGEIHAGQMTHPALCTRPGGPERHATHPLEFWPTAVRVAARR